MMYQPLEPALHSGANSGEVLSNLTYIITNEKNRRLEKYKGLVVSDA
jgi:hypothetical protein